MKGLFYISIVVLLTSCQSKINRTEVEKETSDAIQMEKALVVFSVDANDELGGSAYRKRANRYQVIDQNDTLGLKAYFTESNENNTVGLFLRFSETESYSEQLRLLELIFIKSKSDFDMDSLKSICLYGLSSTGDLAISITSELLEKDDFKAQIEKKEYPDFLKDYQSVETFLLSSRAAKDFNQILNPYSLEVGGFDLEKVMLSPKKYLTDHLKIETDSTEIPDLILDALTCITLKNSDQ